MSQLEIYFTTPHSIMWDGTDMVVDVPAQLLARVWQFQDADIDAPWGFTPRELNFSVSIFDPVFDRVKDKKSDGVKAFNTFVYVEWRGHPSFWGPIFDPDWRMKEGRVHFRCYNQLKRWEAHFLRNGDTAVGLTTIDHRGILKLRDAAEISVGQPYAPVGIRVGSDTSSDRTETVKFEVGQQVLRCADDLLSSSFAPEVREATLKWDIDPPYYSRLDMADALELGTDRHETIFFQGGYGKNNLSDCSLTPGGKIITHAHVTDRGNKHTETRVDVDSATENGVWVDWQTMDFETTDADEDEILGAVAQTIVDNYGRPIDYTTFELKMDDELNGDIKEYYWQEDFLRGDFVTAGVKLGGMYLPESVYRIIGTGLHQENQNAGVRQRIMTVPQTTGTYGTDEE